MSDLVIMKAEIKGTAPLLMHNGRLSDPLDPATKAFKKCSDVQKKTDEDHVKIAKAEWEGGIYVDESGAPCILGVMVDAMLIEGAKAAKQGKAFKSAVFTDQPSYPLLYDGPKSIQKLYESGKFTDRRGVSVKMSRVQRTRPRFNEWALKFSVTLLSGCGINPEDVHRALVKAGIIIGLGDFRPRFGRFSVEKFG